MRPVDDKDFLLDDDFNFEMVQRLKEERASHNLTQEELADAVNLTLQQIKDMETERVFVEIPKLRRLCHHYKLQLLDIMPDTSETRKNIIDLGDISEEYGLLSVGSKDMVNRMVHYLFAMEKNAKKTIETE